MDFADVTEILTRFLFLSLEQKLQNNDLKEQFRVTGSRPAPESDEVTVGIYLYHVAFRPELLNVGDPRARLGETAESRGLLPRLNLYYELSCASGRDGAEGEIEAQELLYLAMEAFDEHPVLEHSTQIGDELLSALRDTTFNLSTTPLPHDPPPEAPRPAVRYVVQAKG